MKNSIECKVLRSKEIVALKAIAITAIPHVSILKKSDDSYQETLKNNTDNLKKLTSEIYQIYKSQRVQHKSCEIAIELLWKTEEVKNQTYNADVKLFLVLRVLSQTEKECNDILEEMASLCYSTLDFQKYDYEDIDYSEFNQVIESVDNTTVRAIVKEDKLTALQNQYLPYAYSYGLFNDGNLSLEKIANLLLEYPNTAISMQLIPTFFSDLEISAIDSTMQNLGTLSGGFFEQGMGNVRFALAEKDYAAYKYYSEQKTSPLFLYNILIYGNSTSTSSIANSISGQLSLNNNVSVKTIDFNGEISLRNNYFPSPWAISEKIIQKSCCYRQFASNGNFKPYTRLAFLITNDEVSTFFKLPIGSDNLSAGFNVRETQKGSKVFAKNIINSGDIIIGKLRSANNNSTIGISLNDLTKHMLITGTPGSGKSTFSVGLLHRLWKDHHIPFLVIEPAKNEYRALVKHIPDLQVFTPGKNTISPFVFNPFVPPKNVKLETYKNALKTAFSAAVSMSSPLDKIFEDAINNCYSDFGWIDTYTIADKGDVFNISDFIKCFSYTFEEIGYKGDASNIGRAGTVRLKSLSNLFDNYFSVPIEDILEKPTVIELSAIENSDQKALIIALVLISILTYANANYLGKGDLKNIILLEEAHTLLDSQSHLGQGEADPSGIAISLLKRMLAEMRSYGVGLIIADQSPRKVTEDIVGLTDIKLTFRLVEATDKKIISDSTNMADGQVTQLTKLKPGEAILFFGKLDQPEEVITPNYRIDNGIDITISDKELSLLATYWTDKQDKLRPYPECAYNKYCKLNCTYNRRLLAKEVARRIFRKEILAKLKSSDKTIKEIDLIKQMFSRFTVLVKKELGDDFTPEILACVKTFMWRKIKYETNILVSDEQIKKSLSK